MDTLIGLRKNASIGEVPDHLKKTRRPRLPDKLTLCESKISVLGPELTEKELKNLPMQKIVQG